MAADEAALARRRGAERATSIWYKLKEGDNTFRILPTPRSKKTQGKWIEYSMHREVGKKKTQVRCGRDPLNNHEGDCWICDVLIPKLRKMLKHERADLLEPRDTLALQVAKLDERDGKEIWSGPFIFTPAQTVGNQILTNILGHKKRDYTDPVRGYNLTLNRTGTGRNDTRYNVLQPDTDPSEVPEALIKKLKPFSELKEIPEYSKAKQQAAYEGRDEVDDQDDDEEEIAEDEAEETEETAEEDAEEEEAEEEETEEEEPPPPPRKKPAAGKVAPAAPAKKKPAPPPEPEEEEELEEEEPEPEEEEEAPPPPKKPGKKKPAPVEEEEDEPELTEDELEELDAEEAEPEEEEAEEEEPPPPPRKKPAAKAPIPIKKPARR